MAAEQEGGRLTGLFGTVVIAGAVLVLVLASVAALAVAYAMAVMN